MKTNEFKNACNIDSNQIEKLKIILKDINVDNELTFKSNVFKALCIELVLKYYIY